MEYVLDTLEMKRCDEAAINEYGIESLVLMERAALETAKIIVEHYPKDENSKFKKFIKNPSDMEIKELFEDKEADVYLFGHTHTKSNYTVNNKYYINPGSLGCPIKSTGANAGILNVNKENIEYTQLEIEYDIQKVINEIKDLNYPLCDFMINNFYMKK